MYTPKPLSSPDITQRESRNTLGKIGHVLGTTERLATENLLLPVLPPESQARLKALGTDIYAGDVLRETGVFNGLPEGIPRNAAYGLGGLVLGAAVDPLTYTGIGGMTKLGRAAGSLGRAADLTSQVARGERGLVSFAGKAFTGPTAAKVGAPLLKPLDAARAGKFLQSVPGLNKSSLYRSAAQSIDSLTSGLAQDLGFNVGVNPWLYRRYKTLLQSILGHGSQRLVKYASELEPNMARFAEDFARVTDQKLSDVYPVIRSHVTRAIEKHPYLSVKNGQYQLDPTMITGQHTTPWDDVFQGVIKEFGLPPSMGGPGSPFDPQAIRELREAVIKSKREYENILMEEAAEQVRHHRLLNFRDESYVLGTLSEDAKKTLRDLADATWRGGSKAGKKTPTVEHASMIMRKLRKIDPHALEDSFTTGAFRKPEDLKAYNALKNSFASNQLPGTKVLNHLWEMVQRGDITPQEVGRIVPSMTRQEANDWIATKGLKIQGQTIQPGQVQNWFLEDPTKLLTMRGMRADRAILSRHFFDELKARPDLVVAKKAATKDHANWTAPNVPELDGYLMDPQASKWLNRMQRFETNAPRELRDFLTIFDNVQNTWKSWTLAIFPVYHARNFVGNTWNYFLANDTPVEALKGVGLSKRIWSDLRRGGNEVITFSNGTTMTGRDLWKAGAKRNLWGSGFISGEFENSLESAIRSVNTYGPDDPEFYVQKAARRWPWGRPLPPPAKDAAKISLNMGPENPWVQAGFRVGGFVEDRFKMAQLVNELDRGLPMDEAIDAVKGVFFDYHDLAPVERQVLRRIFPFWSWSRKNIPFQLEALVTQPGKFARMHGSMRAFEGPDIPKEERAMSDWLAKSYPLRVRKNKNGEYEYLLMKNWLPAADIEEMLHPIEWATMSLTPLAKMPIEQIMNQNLLTKRKIDYMNSRFPFDKGEKQKFLGVNIPTRAHHVLRSVRATSTLNDLIDNPQELDFTSQVLRLFAGRVYPLDYRRSLYHFSRDLEQIDQETKRAVRSAITRDDPDQARSLLREGLERKRRELSKRRFTQ